MDAFVQARTVPGAMTLPGRWYVDEAIFAAEQERIFARSWIAVLRAAELAEPGDYRLCEVAGESIIVVRDNARAVRAYYNVCRHRGTRMCTVPRGRFGGAIQCPYHAWTYGLDGTLLTARTMHEVDGFDRADYLLHEAAVALHDGFVFVNLADEPERFAVAFAPLIGRFDRWSLGTLRTAHTIEYDLACNWKLVFQNYSECYHCPLLHPQLDALSPSESGRNDLVEGPFLGGHSELRAHASSLTTNGATSRSPLGTLAGADLQRIFYYTIFPAMLLSLHPDYVMVHEVLPLSAGRTQVRCRWLFDAATMAAADFDPTDAVAFWDTTNRQDWAISELSQLGIGSRAYTPGPYAHSEGLLAAFDRHYLTTMGRESSPASP